MNKKHIDDKELPDEVLQNITGSGLYTDKVGITNCSEIKTKALCLQNLRCSWNIWGKCFDL